MTPRKEFISFLKRRPNWIHRTIEDTNQIYVQSTPSSFILQTEKKKKYMGMTVIGYLNPEHILCHSFLTEMQVFDMRKECDMAEIGRIPFWYQQRLYTGGIPHDYLQYSQFMNIYRVDSPLYHLVYATLEIKDPEIIHSMQVYGVFDEKYQLEKVNLE